MKHKTITLTVCHITDPTTGLITAFFADDYATVTQGTSMDQVQDRLINARNTIDKARKKYGFRKPTQIQAPITGFQEAELTYELA